MKIQTPNVLVMGEAGSGKTDSLATWIEAGLDLFVIVTEPDGVSSLVDSVRRRKLDINKLHWTTCMPSSVGIKALREMATTIGTMGFEQIQNIKAGIGKSQTRNPAMHFLDSLENFHCERTDEKFGAFDTWNASRVLAIDSWSGISLISMMLTTGYKPTAHQGEWGVAQNFLEQLLLQLTSDSKCFFSLTAHVERETNEITGASRVMVSTLGRKLPPKIPKFFSEVILAKRTMKNNAATFQWATVDMLADLKNRSLPIAPDLQPSFVPIVRAYEKRLEFADAPPQTPAKPPVAA